VELLRQHRESAPNVQILASLRSTEGPRPQKNRGLRILQVNTSDTGGGAAQVALSLHQAYRQMGHASWLAVGYKWEQTPYAITIPDSTPSNGWRKTWYTIGDAVSRLGRGDHGAVGIGRRLRRFAEPRHFLDWWRGIEDFNAPETWRLLELPPEPPDLLHCHRLHSFPFDLRALPHLSERIPTVLTLHDAWMLSGHCGQSFDCERWKTGCGECPDLSIHPPIRRDATAFNWGRKQEIYARSRLYVATPSHWLMRKVKQSILAPAIREARVISNGVDRSVFRPASRENARSRLGLPGNARILLFAATPLRSNVSKDFETVRAAGARVAERLKDEQVVVVALGEDAPPERSGRALVRFVPFERSPQNVASFYQAADVYVHASMAETFGLAIAEAMACGVPVVATIVGGIPEVVDDGQTGLLVPPRDPAAMADAIERLLTDEALHRSCATRAAEKAAERYDLRLQALAYLDWYREILGW